MVILRVQHAQRESMAHSKANVNHVMRESIHVQPVWVAHSARIAQKVLQ